jgi:cardiolipin synthase A/B
MIRKSLRVRAGRGPSVPRSVLVAAVGMSLLIGACARLSSQLTLPEMGVQDPSFPLTLGAYTHAGTTGGNRVDVLLNGEQIFPAQLKAIRAARKTVTYAQYFFEDGSPGREVVEALSERCRAGVHGHVLLDGIGSLSMPPELRDMLERSGCEVAVYHPLSPFEISDVNNRNHRRILVVDGRIGFTGGSGASSKWMGDGRQTGYWRQTDVRIEGPVVNDLQSAFAQTWREITGRVLGGEGYFPREPDRGHVTAQIVRSSPRRRGNSPMYMMFLLAISSARQSIAVTNPYFVPDNQITEALIKARERGVRVTLLLPGEIDHKIVKEASEAGFSRLLNAGVEIYQYQAGLLHAKMMTIDGVWGTIGSANLDNRSLALNDELNLVVYNREVVGRLDRVFAADLAHSRPIDSERWQSRSLWKRLMELMSTPAQTWPVREQL